MSPEGAGTSCGGINLAPGWGGVVVGNSPPPPPPIIPSANSSFGVHLCAFVFWCVRLGEEAAFEDKPLGAGVGRQVRKSF